MSKEIRVAKARVIATALLSGEEKLEAALAETGGVIAALANIREGTGLSVFHAQEALEEAMEVAALLTQARRSFGGLHRKLSATGRQVGVDTTAYGPTEKPEQVAAVEDAGIRRVA